MSERATAKRLSRVERDLARAIGRRCKGRTAIVGAEVPGLAERLERDAVAAAFARDPGDLRERLAGGDRFETIVLAGLLEHAEAKAALPLLREAFELLAPRGRLFACVPNGAPFTRASLKKLLKRLEQPKEFDDQPFRWLLMAITREPALDRPNADRCRAIAELCRGRVLELGCGPGHLTAAIAARGLAVRGVDMNAPKIARAQERYPGIDFRQADILELSADETYDTVVLPEVLEHVPQDVGGRMLDKAWSLVATGGCLVVSVPNENRIRHPNHVREFALDDLVDALRPFGEPRVADHQPLKWLLAHVDRPRGHDRK